jgi:hypothetical protein
MALPMHQQHSQSSREDYPDFDLAGTLYFAYGTSLGVNLTFKNVAPELAAMPG